MAEHAASLLDSDVSGFPATSPEAIMDKYNFLVLPGSLPQRRPQKCRQMRILNFTSFRDVANGREDDSTVGVLNMFESACLSRDTSTDVFLQQIKDIPLQL